MSVAPTQKEVAFFHPRTGKDSEKANCRAICRKAAISLCFTVSMILFAACILVTLCHEDAFTNTSGEFSLNVGIAIAFVGVLQISVLIALHTGISDRYKYHCETGFTMVLFGCVSVLQCGAVISAIWQTHNVIFIVFVLWSAIAQCWCCLIIKMFGCACMYHQKVPEFFVFYKGEKKGYPRGPKLTEAKFREDFPSFPHGPMLLKINVVDVKTMTRYTGISILDNMPFYLNEEETFLATVDELSESERIEYLLAKKKNENFFNITTPVILTKEEYSMELGKTIHRNFKKAGIY